eukprot:COSAG05_NODE_1158_length_5680_cov_39.705787_6_plen_64_part_00
MDVFKRHCISFSQISVDDRCRGVFLLLGQAVEQEFNPGWQSGGDTVVDCVGDVHKCIGIGDGL